MKFIANHIQAIGLLMLFGFIATAAALYWNVPARLTRPSVPTATVPTDNHAGCNHAAVNASADSAATPSGCGQTQTDDGCCSSKPAAPAPAAGGCTRDLATTPVSSTP